MDQKVIEHQKNLENAFTWIEFAYQNGNSLLEAMRGRLADHGFPDPLPALLYSLAKASAYKYLWLDGSWYVPDKGEACERVPFIALTYSTWEWTGSQLVVGVAKVADKNAGLLIKPKKSENRQWLLDEALNWTDHPKTFDVSTAKDGIVKHSLVKAVESYHDGLLGILSAPFPVAWICDESRLDKIAAGLVALGESGDHAPLGALSQEAISAATPEASAAAIP